MDYRFLPDCNFIKEKDPAYPNGKQGLKPCVFIFNKRQQATTSDKCFFAKMRDRKAIRNPDINIDVITLQCYNNKNDVIKGNTLKLGKNYLSMLSINFAVTVSDSSVTAPSAVKIGVSKTDLIEIAVAAADAITLRLSAEYLA